MPTSRWCARRSRPGEVTQLARDHGIADADIVATVQQVLREGPQAFGDLESGVRFWADVWDAVHLEEIYVEITAPAAQRVAPSADMHLDELLDGLPEWTRVHRSTVAVESFAQTLALLHHEGLLVAQDLFVRETGQYAAFRGPGKLEGSIVNWLNGPIFQLVGDRAGFTRARRAVPLSREVQHGGADRPPARRLPAPDPHAGRAGRRAVVPLAGAPASGRLTRARRHAGRRRCRSARPGRSAPSRRSRRCPR